jgi:hypothetical protein
MMAFHGPGNIVIEQLEIGVVRTYHQVQLHLVSYES